jgi:hypothetical protein
MEDAVTRLDAIEREMRHIRRAFPHLRPRAGPRRAAFVPGRHRTRPAARPYYIGALRVH